MRFIPLGSSSHGNAYIVDDGETAVLLECGLTYKRLGKLVREAGYCLSGLDACLVSHEHKDHARCWEKLAEMGVSIYASDGTIQALEAEGRMTPLAPEVGQSVSPPVSIGTMEVLAFRTFHDAREPVGFLIRSNRDGDKLAFATDTGNLRYRFPGLTMLAIEANYQEEILSRCTRIPETTIKRIRHTHMEIGRLCGYLSELDLSRCREVYLLHLSDASSDEGWFEECVRRVVPRNCSVIVCEKGG